MDFFIAIIKNTEILFKNVEDLIRIKKKKSLQNLDKNGKRKGLIKTLLKQFKVFFTMTLKITLI